MRPLSEGVQGDSNRAHGDGDGLIRHAIAGICASWAQRAPDAMGAADAHGLLCPE